MSSTGVHAWREDRNLMPSPGASPPADLRREGSLALCVAGSTSALAWRGWPLLRAGATWGALGHADAKQRTILMTVVDHDRGGSGTLQRHRAVGVVDATPASGGGRVV